MDELSKRNRVFHVFQRLSSTYDSGNRRISLGLSSNWKQVLIDTLLCKVEEGENVLDVCTGTGDIAIALAKRRPDIQVTGLDFSPAMLERARQKGTGLGNLTWIEGDALDLPFADEQFAVACISFGLRNTTDYARVIRGMMRVVRPGGWVFCLDSFVPDNLLVRPFYQLYFKLAMPVLGGGVAYRQEYVWLWQSTQDFLHKHELLDLFRKTGLVNTGYKSKMFGACVLHMGQKPDEHHHKKAIMKGK